LPQIEMGGEKSPLIFFVRIFLEQNKNHLKEDNRMADNKTYWSPSRNYKFELKIGNSKLNLTEDLNYVTILTSIDLPYQSFVLNITIDPNKLIAEEIYGQAPLYLTSILYGTSAATPLERIEFELMYLSSDLPMDVSLQLPGNVDDKRQNITIMCVARKAYTTMNWLVSDVQQGVNLKSVLETLIGKTQATSDIDSQGLNTTTLDQILVPSSTLYKNIQYLNRTFGLYDGMSVTFCSHDNKVYIKNLTAKMTTSEKFVIYQLPSGKDNTEIIKKCTDGKFFYTTEKIISSYKGSSVFAYMAPNMKHIVKPKDRLYHVIDTNTEALAKEYGLISKGNKIFFDSGAMPSDSRISIHKDHTGYELSESFIRAEYSKRVSSITELVVTLGSSMRLLNLMEVGEAVSIDTKITPTQPVNASYILRASQLSFSKAKRDWESAATLRLVRTNRTTT